MTIDEAIKRSEEVMVENMEKTKGRNASDPIAIYCFECAEEYRQLAEWLKDYKRLLEQETCEDSISREWLKIAIHNFYHGLKHTPTEEDIQAYIDVAPPIHKKR